MSRSRLLTFSALLSLGIALLPASAGARGPRAEASIVNGALAGSGEAPWIAFITWHNPRTGVSNWCSASAVSRHLILTAAHCVLNSKASGPAAPRARDYAVRVGSLKGGYPETPLNTRRRYTYAASRVLWDSGYATTCANGGSFCDAGHDFALLYVRQRMSVTPVALNSTYTLNAYDVVHTFGYGAVDPAAKIYPNRLHRGDMYVYYPETCHVSYNSPTVFDGQLCIGWSQGGRQTCHGDSGGPTVIGTGRGAVQVGVTSYGLSGACNAGRALIADVAQSKWVPYWVFVLTTSKGQARISRRPPPTGFLDR